MTYRALVERHRDCDREPVDRPPGRRRRPLELLRDPRSRIVFSGIRNAGKSSLINALLGSSRIPVSSFPETSAEIVVRFGKRRESLVIYPDDSAQLVATDAEIAALSSLYDADGERRSVSSLPCRIELLDPSPALPRDSEFIDTPGINDDPGLSTLALDSTLGGDVVVLVLNSSQCLSLPELDHLRQILQRRGPVGIALVVNVRLDEDTPEAWARFHRREAPALRARVERLLPEAGASAEGLPLFFVSARAFASAPVVGEDFGGGALRSWLQANASPDSPLVRASRQERARRSLNQIDGRIERLRGRADREAAERQARSESAKGDLVASVTGLMIDAIRSIEGHVDAVADKVEAEITASLHRDASHQRSLDRMLAECPAGAVMMNAFDRACSERGFPPMSAAERATIIREMIPRGGSIKVADTPVAKGRTVVVGLLGTVFGLGLGAAAAAASHAAAMAEKRRLDQLLTIASLKEAAEAAKARVIDRIDEIEAALTDHAWNADPIESDSHEARLRLLEARHRHVVRLLDCP